MSRRTSTARWLLIVAALLAVSISTLYHGWSGAPVEAQRSYEKPKPSPGATPKPGEPTIALKPKHPSHKIVCSCQCGNVTETHDLPIGGCGDLHGIGCGTRSEVLKNCNKKSVVNEIKALAGLEEVTGVGVIN
jgi:alpha-tubulin suppressor-like RCC1 family protein